MNAFKILVISIFFFCLCACDDISTNGGSSNIDTTTVKAQVSTTPTKKNADAPISIEAIEKSGQVVSVTTFNNEIKSAQDSDWTKSPVLVALKFGGESMDCRKKTIDLESASGENFNQLLVTITEDGLLDDSFKGSMLIMRLSNNNGLWQIKKATRAWNCYRGHKEFNSEPCN